MAKEEKNTKGIVYILANESFKPGIYKIGITALEKLSDRVKELSSYTAVPLPFEPVFACEVDQYQDVEKDIHQMLDKYCIRKEFFVVDPQKVVNILKHMKGFKIITNQMDKLIEEKASTEATKYVKVTSKNQIPTDYDTTEKMKGELKLTRLFGFRLAVTHNRMKIPYYKLGETYYFKKSLFDQQVKNEKIGKNKLQQELNLT